MPRNKGFIILYSSIIFLLCSCAQEDENRVSEQDQKLLDEAAQKLDEQMPAARAERSAKGEQE